MDVVLIGADAKQTTLAGVRAVDIAETPSVIFYSFAFPDGKVVLVNPTQIALIREIK